jgi:FixJ family two-component response regulator
MIERKSAVAIIEDDQGVRDALETLLSGYGYQLELYESAESFLEQVEHSVASCLLIDVHLGDLSGVELARQLMASGHSFPTIFMTGACDDFLRRQAFELGCIAFLQKPMREEQLIESIVEAIGRYPDFS